MQHAAFTGPKATNGTLKQCLNIIVFEYEDGKRSTILMDGWIQVQLQDRGGKYWYLREWSK